MGVIGTILKPNRLGCREHGDRPITTDSTTIIQDAPQLDQPAPGRCLAPEAGGGAGAHANWSTALRRQGNGGSVQSASARPATSTRRRWRGRNPRAWLCTVPIVLVGVCTTLPAKGMRQLKPVGPCAGTPAIGVLAVRTTYIIKKTPSLDARRFGRPLLTGHPTQTLPIPNQI